MKIKFESTQDYQLAAVNSVVEVFEGQPLSLSSFEYAFRAGNSSIRLTDHGIANNLVLNEDQILENLKELQLKNRLAVSEQLVSNKSGADSNQNCKLNFSIEMETGTGKTYTYIRTIYRLNQLYGFKKFVVVVPSIAIREGALKNLKITFEHFQELYNNPSLNFKVYDPRALTILRNFATSNNIEILVINIDSFAKDGNVINNSREIGIRPIEYIQKSRPIVIVDEPQNMETEIRRAAINNLNPLFTLRYSATHKNHYNLIYSLNPVKAYELGLVKQIEVDGVTANHDYNTAFVKLVNVDANTKHFKVRLLIHCLSLFDVADKVVSASLGDDLFELSGGREVYRDGYILNSISNQDGKYLVEFSNGIVLSEDEAIGFRSDELLKYQIERTIYHHFEKEVRYWKRMGHYAPIKVLSLFFIDKVSHYRQYDEQGNPVKGKYAIWFEEIFNRYIKKYQPLYPDLFTLAPPESYFAIDGVHESDIPSLHPEYWNAQMVHNGYFSKDKKGNFKDTKGSSQDDEDTYSLIMKDKERLLSLNEPLRFIFSHSALREGWDNPNIFQICTLNESKSEVKKRQEIGRGLRLAVDSEGTQVRDKRINILTVIANESYENFSAGLQKEILDETSVEFVNKIRDANKKEQIKLSKELTAENFPLLFDIWEKISQKTRYSVAFNSTKLIQKVLADLANYNIVPLTKQPLMESRSGVLNFTDTGINSKLSQSASKYTEANLYPIPDIYSYVQSRVDISRQTIFEILKGSNRLKEVLVNPQTFLDNIIKCIKNNLNKLLVEGLKYEEVNGQKYQMTLFELEEVEGHLADLFTVCKPEKSPFNFIAVDSAIESVFAGDCEADDNIKFFFKIPRGFKIPTPIGNYNPDWAIVFQDQKKMYFVAETKGTLDRQYLREVERMKIECGEKHFALFKNSGVEYHLAVNARDLY
ncbi:type III restriction enzyme [Pedobacter westerhofensis]|uniref:Type III restriction enzyme n=1 Tax=Pedobacter westerhofensis TaxID=425512 RepID=A0A521FVW1_9SPHI|nr:DEAD/DEAH box helicase family protein [Pedobacter westerhofensis]SMO99860.1 type III restriction enzyme [Pedobacter westerhofensis]